MSKAKVSVPGSKGKKGLAVVLFMGLVLAGALALVFKSQETRRGAYFATAKLELRPRSGSTAAVGESVIGDLFVTGLGNTKIDGMDLEVSFDSCVLSISEANVEVDESTFPMFQIVNIDPGKSCAGKLSMMAGSDKPAADLKGDGARLASLTFVGTKEGTSQVGVETASAMLTGDNPGSLDKAIEVGEVMDWKVTISGGGSVEPTVPPVSGSVIEAKIRPRGVSRASEYSDRIQGEVVFYDQSQTEVHRGAFVAERTEEKRADSIAGVSTEGYVYLAQIPIGNLTSGSYSLFLKGSKHLARVICQDGQDAKCVDVVAGISLKEGAVYDFSGLPLEPGDVVQEGEEYNRVNVADFSRLKEMLGQTGASQGDLNYDGVVNGADITLLLGTLSEKYGELL